MTPLEQVEALSRLRGEIATALEGGTWSDDLERKFDTFEFLWKTTPDTQRETLEFTLQDLAEMRRRLRLSAGLRSGHGKMRSKPLAAPLTDPPILGGSL